MNIVGSTCTPAHPTHLSDATDVHVTLKGLEYDTPEDQHGRCGQLRTCSDCRVVIAKASLAMSLLLPMAEPFSLGE